MFPAAGLPLNPDSPRANRFRPHPVDRVKTLAALAAPTQI
jgi:hypothetical protein